MIIHKKNKYTFIHDSFYDKWLKVLDRTQILVVMYFCKGNNSKEISEILGCDEAKVLAVDDELEKMGVYADMQLESEEV